MLTTLSLAPTTKHCEKMVRKVIVRINGAHLEEMFE